MNIDQFQKNFSTEFFIPVFNFCSAASFCLFLFHPQGLHDWDRLGIARNAQPKQPSDEAKQQKQTEMCEKFGNAKCGSHPRGHLSSSHEPARMEGTSFCFSQRRTAWAVLISANQGDPWAANHLKNAHCSTVLVRV